MTKPSSISPVITAFGDFLGVFLSADGQLVEPYLPSAPVSNIGRAELYAYARRADTPVVLVASMFMKIPTIKKALEMKVCNALILDEHTASVMISHLAVEQLVVVSWRMTTRGAFVRVHSIHHAMNRS